MNNVKEIATDKVLSSLEKFSLKEKIEILANVLISLGINQFDKLPESINTKNVIEFIINERKNNGESIATALATQGFLMLTWIDR